MFKQNFEKICVEKGYSPTSVCVAIGISKSNYSNWTDGTTPRKTTLIKIAEYLGVSVEQLTKKEKTTLSEEEKLVSLIADLTDEETKELASFVDYLISKRK